MLKFIAMVLTLSATPALAQSYLILPDVATAAAVSAAQCARLGCDGVNTKYWWEVQPLTDGTAALVIQPSGDFAATVRKNIGDCATTDCGLSAAQITALSIRAALANRLPNILLRIGFLARFTAGQIVQANNSANPAVTTKWNAIKAGGVGSTVDLTDPDVIAMVNAMTADGIITATDAIAILAPIAVAAGPQ